MVLGLRDVPFRKPKCTLRGEPRAADPSRHATYTSLSSAEKEERLRNLHSLTRHMQRRVECLKAKVAVVTESQGVAVEDPVHTDLHSIMLRENDSIPQAYPEGSFVRIFWDQQLNGTSRKKTRAFFLIFRARMVALRRSYR